MKETLAQVQYIPSYMDQDIFNGLLLQLAKLYCKKSLSNGNCRNANVF